MDPLRQVCKKDKRYRLEAYQFLFDALDKTVRTAGLDEESEASRHVSGHELLDGMREHATRLFGPLAAQVWRTWGVQSTMDWGHIVFNLVDNELLRRQDSDTIDDFREGYNFDDVFKRAYRPALPAELGAYPRPPAGQDGGAAADDDAHGGSNSGSTGQESA